MNMSQSPISKSEMTAEHYSRNGRIITIVLMSMTVPTALLFGYLGYINNLPQLFISSVLLIATTFFDILPLGLLRQKRHNLAMLLVGTAFVVNVLIVPLLVQGLGLIIAASILLVIFSISGLAVDSRYSATGVIAALIFAAAAIVLDSSLGGDRIQVPLLQVFTPYIVVGMAIPIVILFLREFNNFGLQTKISLGVLMTGGMTVGILALFVFNRANIILASLSERFEESVAEQTESQILITVQSEAEKANLLFEGINSDLLGVAEYRARLETQKSNFAASPYWNSAERLFQLPGGQVGNSATDIASVFIPRGVTVTDEMLTDINTSMYLDFIAPGFLDSHPEVVALYFISSTGYTVYYPNIELAENVPADFNPTAQTFYTIATPEQNPDSLPQWTKPYQDPAGAGLIVTLSMPVYTRTGVFKGVIGADVQVSRISSALSEIKLGETDFAFLVDKNGFILSMPEAGYRLFDLEPEEVPINESPSQSIFDTDEEILQFAAQRIIINPLNLFEIRINGVDTYLGISTLEETGYKLVILAPADELNSEILASRTEVQNEITATLENAGVILLALFIGALLVSIWVGQVITQPMKRMTGTVEEIASGNLNARVMVESTDETGILARSFNTMADRLVETLQNLEDRVAERTLEIEKISEANAYRAAQFESIARISSIISSTQALERLLPQIAETISEKLGFYHTGIFLLDAHKEFAVLVAANSEGGRRMLDRGHRLRVGETGIVGNVTHTGQPRIALDVGADAVFFNNPDLPETRSEIALPLKAGAEIIGALDVQSIETNAFTQEDVNILSSLADQVSIAIQNARSYQRSREALEQSELAAAQMSEQQWSQFLARQGIHGYHFDGVDARRLESGNYRTPHSIAIPLILRGTQIGTLKLSTPNPDRVWDEDEIALAQATAERTALAIENARLLQEAQKRAAKERTIGEISAKIGNLVNLDNILQTTVQELGSTLPGTDVAIQFISGKPGQK